MQTETIKEQIQTFILERFPLARKRRIGSHDQLLENGLIDSLGVLELVSFLEQKFEIAVHDEELLPEMFQSIECLTMFVRTKWESRQ